LKVGIFIGTKNILNPIKYTSKDTLKTTRTDYKVLKFTNYSICLKMNVV